MTGRARHANIWFLFLWAESRGPTRRAEERTGASLSSSSRMYDGRRDTQSIFRHQGGVIRSSASSRLGHHSLTWHVVFTRRCRTWPECNSSCYALLSPTRRTLKGTIGFQVIAKTHRIIPFFFSLVFPWYVICLLINEEEKQNRETAAGLNLIAFLIADISDTILTVCKLIW